MSLLLFLSLDDEGAGVPVTAPPTVFGVQFTDPFALLVERADRAALRILGGVVITYKPKVGAAVVVTGIFDSAFVLAKGDAHAGIESGEPVIFLRVNDLPADPDLDDPVLTIRGLDYRVVERKSDGIGGIMLALRLIN